MASTVQKLVARIAITAMLCGMAFLQRYALRDGLLTEKASLTADEQTGAGFFDSKTVVGTLVYSNINGGSLPATSQDFLKPKGPVPDWQVAALQGNVYLLRKLGSSHGASKKSIALSQDVSVTAKVQILCTFSELTLGEI